MLKDQKGVVSLWLGSVVSKTEFEGYFAEHYDDDDDDAPINEFARDLGQAFYDHDLQELAWHPAPRPINALLAGHSWAESFVDAVIVACREADLNEANAVVLLYDQVPEGVAATMGIPVRLVGSFPYKKA